MAKFYRDSRYATMTEVAKAEKVCAFCSVHAEWRLSGRVGLMRAVQAAADQRIADGIAAAQVWAQQCRVRSLF